MLKTGEGFVDWYSFLHPSVDISVFMKAYILKSMILAYFLKKFLYPNFREKLGKFFYVIHNLLI